MLSKILSNLNSSRIPFFRLSGFLLLFMFVSGSVSLGQVRINVKTDLGLYPAGSPPALSYAGAKTNDPVFGTQIMRVTGATDGGNFGTAYSYWSTFNSNSTRLIVQSPSGGANLYQFDPVSFTLGNKRPWPLPPGTGFTTSEDAVWSANDPDLLFVHQGAAFYAFNASSGSYSLLGYLNSQFPSGSYFWQMSVSRDDDVFAFTVRNPDYSIGGYAVWRRSTNTVIYSVRTSVLDEVQIDKTGQYLVVKTGQEGAGVIEVKVINLRTQAVTDLTDNEPDFAPGHSDNGSGVVVGDDNWQNRITYRSLSSPHDVRTVISFGNNWQTANHVSLLANNESWVLVSFYGGISPSTFNNELVLVATDGSQRVRRFAHHYSAYTDYDSSPRANISRDGKFVAFTSNWGNSGRRDLFIAKVPSLTAKPWENSAAGSGDGGSKFTKSTPNTVTMPTTTIVTRTRNGTSTLTNH